MRTYTEGSTASQAVIDTVEILAIKDAPQCLAEWKVLQGRLPAEPPIVTEARWNIIEAYESGAIGAVEALYALEANGCLTDADDFLCSFIAGTKARLNLGETPPVSPDVDAGQPKPIPSYSPQPELLNVLAGVRALASGGEA